MFGFAKSCLLGANITHTGLDPSLACPVLQHSARPRTSTVVRTRRCSLIACRPLTEHLAGDCSIDYWSAESVLLSGALVGRFVRPVHAEILARPEHRQLSLQFCPRRQPKHRQQTPWNGLLLQCDEVPYANSGGMVWTGGGSADFSRAARFTITGCNETVYEGMLLLVGTVGLVVVWASSSRPYFYRGE